MTNPSLRAWRETLVAFKDDLRQNLTSPFSLVLLISYLLFNVVLTLPYVGASLLLTRKLAESQGGAAASAAVESGKLQVMAQLFTQLTGDPAEGMAMASIPMPALYIFFLASLFVPVLAVLTSADMISDDLRSGHIRYLALRSARGSLLAGRLASRGVLLSVTVLAATLSSYLLFLWKIEDLPLDAFQHFLRFGLLLAGISLTYTGLAALCSTLVRGSLLALVLGIFLLLITGLVDLIPASASTLGWGTPNHYKLLLFSPDRWPLGLLAYLGFAALFSGLAWLRLRTRDL